MNERPFRVPVLSTVAFFLLGAIVCPARPRAAEVRAIWITRWDYKTEDDVRRAVRWCAALGLNRIFFQVRGRADAFYRSPHEPWGEELGGVDPGFDPLEAAVDEAAKSGVDLDAWINVMPGWKGGAPPRSPDHVFHKHPEWFLVDRQGKRHMRNPTDYTILNPCLPEVRAYLIDIVKDLMTRYAVSGIQLDYIRFVGRDADHRIDFPYDPRTLQLFRKYSGMSPFDKPEEWDRWRGLSIDTLVYRLSEAARKARPGCRVSVAAIQDYDRARKDLFQDVVKWQSNGWIDEVFPMTYHQDDDVFTFQTRSALAKGPKGKVLPGIGVHLHASAGATARQIVLARKLGAGGYALFAFASFFPSPSHESQGDATSKRLRAALRAKLKELNGVPPAARIKPSRTVSANVPRS